MSVQRRVFPESFKREAVDRVANSGLSAGAVARELGAARDGASSMDDAVRDAGDGGVAATHNAGVVPVAVGSGRRGCPATAGERAAADGAGHPKKSRAHLRSGLPVKFGHRSMGIVRSGRFA